MSNDNSEKFPKEVSDVDEAKQVLKNNSQAVKMMVSEITKQKESVEKFKNKK